MVNDAKIEKERLFFLIPLNNSAINLILDPRLAAICLVSHVIYL